MKATRWMGQEAFFDPRPGGEYRVEVISGETSPLGEFVEVDPPRRLVFTWGWEPGRPSACRPDRARSRSTWCPTATAPCCASGTAACRTRTPRSATATAGTTTCARLEIAARGDDPGRDPWLDGG